MKLDSIHHIALIVSDYAASKDFYVRRLGFSVIRMICRLSSMSENKELLLYSETGSPVCDREKLTAETKERAMKLIESFSVDHTRIVPGIFTSRIDHLGKETVTTYDVRLRRPNREPVIDVAAMHSLEHIIATYLRNDETWKDEVIYWGPMGCLTGFYLILKGNRSSRELYNLILSAFRYVDEVQEVPGATAVNCGYYLMHNLDMAKWYAKEFADYLAANAENSDIFEYPKTERLVTEAGQHFYDS